MLDVINDKWFSVDRLLVREAEDIRAVESGEDVSQTDFGAYHRLLKHNQADWVRHHAIMDCVDADRYARQVASITGNVRSMLDAGCGPGAITDALRARLGCAATGVDISTSAIAFAKQRYPGCDFIARGIDGNARFPATYDLIHAREFYPFTRTSDEKTHEEYLRLFLKHLNPGGVIVLALLSASDSIAASFRLLNVEGLRMADRLVVANTRLVPFAPLRLAAWSTNLAGKLLARDVRHFYVFRRDE